MTRPYILSAAVLLISTLYPTAVWSQPQHSFAAAPMLLAQNQKAQQTISKEQAIRIAQRQVSGKVLSANLVTRGPQQHYRVKMLTDKGRVKTVVVNAKR